MKLFQDPLTTALWPNLGRDPKVSKHWFNFRKLPDSLTKPFVNWIVLERHQGSSVLLLGRVGLGFHWKVD